MKEKEITALADENIMHTYRRFPVVLARGKGQKVWDVNGKEYLDFVAGIAVCNLGHSHPGVIDALKKQLEKLTHVSNLYYTEPQARLAKLLVDNSFADKVFFCNSGAEANEAAIKLARKYAHENLGADKFELITMKDSFHGRTMATITATGQEKFQFGFTPLLEGFTYVPFNDLNALEKAINKKTCGVMVEPIQGEGGVNIPDARYLKEVRSLCDEHKILLIVDEVQTGIGRTGKLFAYEHAGIEPDIMTLAKALGNGFPVGAMLATDKIAESFAPGNHASTFGGNPLAMAAALATLEIMLQEGILDNCRKTGDYFLKELKKLEKKHALINNVRGKGLMLAVTLNMEAAEIVRECMQKGLLINSTGGKTLRFVPPLIITNKDVDQAVDILNEVMEGK
ncbi:MAG TPA: acetylornithine transaminase [Smithellaceae bacterium]|jgi:predicted acetylornithine/succinylornithine family transaminase|nr:acetylornithine transaminase [Syntrophaceae bacterium]MDX9816203.1 acetylornithine transaminase [Smithellaceae bacterium]MBP8609629.1 acetylornithine transaminase [Syntrophaceae bacterium]HOU04783.1 acetylornithine transaminase [Smithellaceae bacterium]HQG23612.1 acetylornithine transaminase [Smithellaceae bacterium]